MLWDCSTLCILIDMSTFANTLNPTPFGLYDSDLAFQAEADSMILFVKRALGDDVVSVALPKKTIWALFEEAAWEFSRIINEHRLESNYENVLGLPTGSNLDQYPRETLDHLIRQAEPYAMEAGYQGFQDHVSGSISLEAGKQDYDLLENLVVDGTSTPLFQTQTSGSFGNMRIMEVFHFSPIAAYRFFDSTSAINFLNNEFSFESFTPETIFYVLPVFEDLLRAGQMQISQRVRRSNYAYKIRGTHIRLFPTPTGDFPKKLWVRVMFPPNPLSPSYQDDSLNGINNPADVIYPDLTFSELSTWAKAWIRKYALALCMITLGYIRGKYSSGIPVPTGEVQLNYGDLLAHGREDKIAFTEELKETLKGLTNDAIIEKEANKTDNLMRQLRGIPMPNGYFIVPG